jgi:hypothetical protein
LLLLQLRLRLWRPIVGRLLAITRPLMEWLRRDPAIRLLAIARPLLPLLLLRRLWGRVAGGRLAIHIPWLRRLRQRRLAAY